MGSLDEVTRLLRGPIGSRVALRLAEQDAGANELTVELRRVPQEQMVRNGVMRGTEHLHFEIPRSPSFTNTKSPLMLPD